MNTQKNLPKRRSIRLCAYDYAQEGMYYVTLCTHARKCLFGHVVNDEVQLSDIGNTVKHCWENIPEHYPTTEVDSFVVMPNHFHGIISINDASYAHHTLGLIIRSFKSAVTYRVRKNHTIGTLWQRNYYEHVIRDEKDYRRIAEYIQANPFLWDKDALHPKNSLQDPLLIENP